MSEMIINRVISKIKRSIVACLPKHCVKVPVRIPVLEGALLRNRKILVTGGTSGIGLAMAKAFIRNGANVVITGRSNERIESALSLLGPNANGIVLDNVDVESFADKVDECVHKFGLPDVLVNNAGLTLWESFGSANVANYDIIMDTNLRGAFFLSQEVSNIWKEGGVHGNILNVGSSSSLRPGNSPYVLSKWGIRSLTVGLAKELIRHGIVVNGIAPGPTATSLFVGDGKNGINRQSNPSGRLVTEDEVANLAVVLVSDLGRMVVGDMLFVTGGAGVITVDDV